MEEEEAGSAPDPREVITAWMEQCDSEELVNTRIRFMVPGNPPFMSDEMGVEEVMALTSYFDVFIAETVRTNPVTTSILIPLFSELPNVACEFF